jgi:hypothetical protein
VKLSFEGPNFHSILVQIRGLLAAADHPVPHAAPSDEAQGPGPDPFDSGETFISPPGDNPVGKPVEKPRTEKQKANDERLRQAALAKAAAAKKAAPPPPVDEPEEEDQDEAPPPPPKAVKAPKAAKAAPSPEEIVKLRQSTISDLQTAYANGKQAEVFELLSRFGNGAKSFRELPPDAFVPIRDAIDKGALT